MSDKELTQRDVERMRIYRETYVAVLTCPMRFARAAHEYAEESLQRFDKLFPAHQEERESE